MGIGFVKFPFVREKFVIFGYPTKQNHLPLINSPVSGQPPYFSLVSTYGNNSRKRTALLTDAFFSTRGSPPTRELNLPELTMISSAISLLANKSPGYLIYTSQTNFRTWRSLPLGICRLVAVKVRLWYRFSASLLVISTIDMLAPLNLLELLITLQLNVAWSPAISIYWSLIQIWHD